MNIKVKLMTTRPDAAVPRAATPYSAGYDLSSAADGDIIIAPGEIVRIPTGISIEPERTDVVGLVFGRSGLGTKFGITLANSVGVIDADFRGEIMVSLINRGAAVYTVHPGDRIAQLVFMPFFAATFELCSNLTPTERGSGGFGSTGAGTGGTGNAAF